MDDPLYRYPLSWQRGEPLISHSFTEEPVPKTRTSSSIFYNCSDFMAGLKCMFHINDGETITGFEVYKDHMTAIVTRDPSKPIKKPKPAKKKRKR